MSEIPAGDQMTYREAVNAALLDEMERDESVVLIGEDVGVGGGVFKTNEGLAERFGPARVINTPICENGFTGLALGMAVTGFRPIVEIMFADFLPTAGDELMNQLPKFRFMSGGQMGVPVTIRAIGGGTARFGSQHSATGESWYLQAAGLRICAAASPSSAYALLRTAIREPNPVLFLEHKALYGRRGMVDRQGWNNTKLGKAAVVREGRDLTIVATLLMLDRALEAATILALEGIESEVVDLRWIAPMDCQTVRDSVKRTGQLIVVEEQYHVGGWGASLISQLAIGGAPWRGDPVSVSFPASIPLPFSPPLEDYVIPTVDRIAGAIRTACAGPAGSSLCA